MASFTEHLRARGEVGLARLLAARPDLASPAPSSVRSLSARATHRTGLERALAAVDAAVLTVLEAVLALDGPGGGPTTSDVARATGVAPEDTRTAVRTAMDLALLWTDATPGDGTGAGDRDTTEGELALHPAPGLGDVLGPHPAGLGPPLRASLNRRSVPALTRLAHELGRADLIQDAETASRPDQGAAATLRLADRLADHLADPATVSALVAQAPPGARHVLDALTWGTPVGRSPASATDGGPAPGRAAVDWLLRHGLLAVGDPQHVVLPREVSLALRGGRTHREPPAPPTPSGAPVDARTVAAESAIAAEEVVRLVGAVVTAWGQEPPAVLRAGGVASRELRRLAARLHVAEPTTALVLEVAGAAGLLADDGEAPASILPTSAADEWQRLDLPERWAWLAEAWLTTDRAAWLVGTRDERGSLRAALDPELRRPWATRLRVAVLDVLAGAGTPDAPQRLTADAVHEVLRWRTPRAVPPPHAVEAVLAEAGTLGVLGGGALSVAGRALVATAAGTPAGAPGPAPAVRGLAAPEVAAALAAQLAPTVEEVLLQGDLTGIVPGRPSPDLAALLEQAAQVESRGAGLTVRFTEASVRRALDTGRPAEDLLAALSRHARGGVPQPLEYLVLDTARRHGRVRVGAASSYLRADDVTLLAGLVDDRALRPLGLLQLAPGVIAAQVPPATLLAALRERGLAPVAEGPGGQVVLHGPAARRASTPRTAPRPPGRPATGSPGAGSPGTDAAAGDRRLLRLAKDLIEADRRETASLALAVPDGTAGAGTGPHDRTGERTGTPGHPPTVSSPGSGTSGHRGSGDGQSGQSGQDPPPAGAAGSGGTPDPVLALALLREAAARGSEVWLEVVGPGGTPSRRKVRPLRVDEGRVRALDTEREAELTVAVHRIAGVTLA